MGRRARIGRLRLGVGQREAEVFGRAVARARQEDVRDLVLAARGQRPSHDEHAFLAGAVAVRALRPQAREPAGPRPPRVGRALDVHLGARLLPLGLILFQKSQPAAVFTIAICAMWPTVLNTAVGVRSVPQDYLNVARVLNLSEWKVFTKILFPAVLPYMITGVRLSIGVAWLVIVAAEMLTGGVGIGFWVWDEWNNLNVQHIIIAIFTVGLVGLALEQAMILLARRFSYE